VFKAKENCDSKYLYYLLSQDSFFEYSTSTSKGTKMPRGDKKAIMDFKISLPPLSEQKRIASILSALDAKIAVNKEINKRLEQMARAIFKSWFVDNVSEQWRTVQLGDITQDIRTKVGNQRFPVFSAVKTGNLTLSEDYFTKQVYSNDIGKYIAVKPNDFAYNPARVNIGSLGRNTFDYTGCVSPVYVVFRAEPEYHLFLQYFFKSVNFQEEVRVRASGSVRQSLNYNDFALIQLIYPPIEIVRSFNSQCESFIGVTRKNETENQLLSTVRDSLLPRLMSGENLSKIGVV
jgi:type I restriction enzyme S subunit